MRSIQEELEKLGNVTGEGLTRDQFEKVGDQFIYEPECSANMHGHLPHAIDKILLKIYFASLYLYISVGMWLERERQIERERERGRGRDR